MNGTNLSPRRGKDLIDFAHRVIQILRACPWGVDQELFLYELFNGSPPQEQHTRDFYWDEFKRAKDYSNEMFNRREDGWLWVRARRGLHPGQFYYQAVAQIQDGEPEIIISLPVSGILLQETESQWLTRTKSHMRVKVAHIEAKRKTALTTGNPGLLQEAERELDDIFVFSTRLAAINFDTGLTIADLKALSRSERVPALLHNAIKRTLNACERYQEQAKKLSTLVYKIGQMRRGAK